MSKRYPAEARVVITSSGLGRSDVFVRYVGRAGKVLEDDGSVVRVELDQTGERIVFLRTRTRLEDPKPLDLPTIGEHIVDVLQIDHRDGYLDMPAPIDGLSRIWTGATKAQRRRIERALPALVGELDAYVVAKLAE